MRLKLYRNVLSLTIFKKTYKLWTFKSKDYSLDSGERQISQSLEGIRVDHLNRYNSVISFLSKKFAHDAKLKGMDVFCGTGYGTYMISQIFTNTEITGIDGSQAAINFGKKHYKNKNIKYYAKKFPFKLKDKDKGYDFIVSLESVEHVTDDAAFFDLLIKSLKPGGYLFLSTPNTDEYNRECNNDGFHVRHYSNKNVINFFKSNNFKLIKQYGQNCYVFNEYGKIISEVDSGSMELIEDYNGQFMVFIFEKGI